MQHKLKQDPGGDQRGKAVFIVKNDWHFRRYEMTFNAKSSDV